MRILLKALVQWPLFLVVSAFRVVSLLFAKNGQYGAPREDAEGAMKAHDFRKLSKHPARDAVKLR